jgi:hypothetical protein
MDEKYLKRVWLNNDQSPSTGSVVAYHGPMMFKIGEKTASFLEISDCHNKVRLHVSPMDSMDDFIQKLELLSNTINDFKTYLKNKDANRGCYA